MKPGAQQKSSDSAPLESQESRRLEHFGEALRRIGSVRQQSSHRLLEDARHETVSRTLSAVNGDREAVEAANTGQEDESDHEMDLFSITAESKVSADEKNEPGRS